MTTQTFEDERYDICHNGRELRHIRTEEKEMEGYTQTLEVYGCACCSGCEHKAKCLYRYNLEKDVDKNKERIQISKVKKGFEIVRSDPSRQKGILET